MQSRLARVFRPATGRTVMLAIDHGYFQGPTTGLERVDLSIVPLLPYADALMTTRGMVRSTIPPAASAADRAAGQRRPEHPAGTVRRADRGQHGGRRAAERRGRGGAGVHRRRVRDPVGAQHDPAGGPGPAVRDPGAGRHRGRPGADPGRALPAAGHPDLRRAGRARGQDLLLRGGLRHRHRRPARCRWSWPAARSCPSSTRSPWPTAPSRRARPGWTWAATSSRASTRRR